MRARWTRERVVAVAVGGAVGATLRWAVFTTTASGSFPWPVLVVNIAGSLLLGVVLAEEWTHPTARLLLHDGVGIGFCGGLTTFSTFAVEVAQLGRDGDVTTAATYAVASVAGALLAIVAGAAGLGQVQAVRLRLEERP
jgi:CrcB protein